jgi:hypothetical protein
VLEKHAELHAAVGEESRLHNTNLAAEINTLLDQARTDRDELREAVDQQDRYEAELRSLSSSVNESQERLLGSPILASSVDDLKAQITERNVSTNIRDAELAYVLYHIYHSLFCNDATSIHACMLLFQEFVVQ